MVVLGTLSIPLVDSQDRVFSGQEVPMQTGGVGVWDFAIQIGVGEALLGLVVLLAILFGMWKLVQVLWAALSN